MTVKPYLVTTIRWWAFALLTALAVVLIAANTIQTRHESDARIRQMRTQYIEKQRQMIRSEVVNFTDLIEHEMEKTVQEAKIRVKTRISAASAMARNLYDQNKENRTKTDIQKIIIDALRPIRLDMDGGYYFISDFDGIIQLFADRPDQESISFLGRRDTRGRYVVKDMIDIVKFRGEGFYTYHWTKPGRQGNNFEKLAYVKAFEPFDWLIGTGIYLDDLESAMQQTILQYTRTRRFGPGGAGYVFVYELLDLNGGKDFARIYANPNLPGQTGKLISDDYKDARGKPFRKEFLKGLQQNGECYVDYWYKKIGDTDPGPKTSFFKLAGNGRFIVAAGMYMDDVEDRILLMQRDLDRQLQQSFFVICAIFIAGLSIVLMLAGILNRRLEKDFKVFSDVFQHATDNSRLIDREKVRFTEFDRLAGFANRMLSQKTEAEKDLRSTQKRLTEAQRMARVGHYIYDINNDCWTNSQELNNLFGIAQNFQRDMAGWLDCVHPDHRDAMAAYLKEDVLNRHGQFDREYKVIDQKSGRKKWVHGLGSLTFNNRGEPLEMFGTIQDITERRQMEDSLRLTQFIFDKAAMGIFHIASDGQILNVNEQAAKDLGYTRENLAGMTVFDINPTVTPETFGPIWETIVTEGKDSFETLHRRSNGQFFPVEVVSNRLEYNGQIFSISFVQDITERKEVADALRQSKERLSGIVDSMADWVWEVDANGHYLYCSANVLKVLGYTPEEMTGRLPFDFMAPDEAEKIRRAFRDICSHKAQIKDLENWNICKDGRQICLLTNGVPILDESGRLQGYRGVDKDITRRKQAEKRREDLEAQLRQAHKMEAIGTLAGGIAHDFNNILSGMLGYAQLALSHMDAPDKAARHIQQVILGTRRATDLTKQILTFSRQSEYQKLPFKIYLEVKEALKLIRSSIPTTIEIRTRLDSRKQVLADPIKIHQVIMNLCTNAYHAMRKTGGCLEVSLTDLDLSGEDRATQTSAPPGEYICLTVSDTGHGMDEATLEKAFEPYFTTKEKGDGTGLGLALVQAIVEEHDGFLDVRSQVGTGTSFTLLFPIVSEDETARDPAVTEKAPLLPGTETIMLVDDEDQIRESCREFLEDSGYRVQAFANGRDAFDAFKENPDGIDFVITDMTMPGMTGDRLAREMLKISPGLPVILCTGFSENISREKTAAMGIRHFIQKPILHDELAALVRDILDRG